MRSKVLRVLFIGLAVLLGGCGGTSFELSDGEQLKWDDLRGDWVFINYWAVWCKPCIEEIPQLNKVAGTGLGVVLGVNFDHPVPEELVRQASKLGIAFPVLTNDPAVALSYPRPDVLPVTVIFDPQGNYHGVLLGPQTLQTIEAAIK
jgi:thiol-disulfide isomerase/thioredoxin